MLGTSDAPTAHNGLPGARLLQVATLSNAHHHWAASIKALQPDARDLVDRSRLERQVEFQAAWNSTPPFQRSAQPGLRSSSFLPVLSRRKESRSFSELWPTASPIVCKRNAQTLVVRGRRELITAERCLRIRAK
jgi:hypothetical protein